jgi:hypothetical protein
MEVEETSNSILLKTDAKVHLKMRILPNIAEMNFSWDFPTQRTYLNVTDNVVVNGGYFRAQGLLLIYT